LTNQASVFVAVRYFHPSLVFARISKSLPQSRAPNNSLD
jgi:hypothetical protein